MGIWTLTVVDSIDIVTTTHSSLAGALECFSDNFDTMREFPRTVSGVQAAAYAMGIRAEITEHG